MPSLTSLPVEVLAHISSFVSTQDFGALRLTCKHTESCLYRWFLDEFFTKKQFMLTQPSLQALLDISQHATFSKQLKHLIIATDVYDDRSFSNTFRDDAARSSYMQGYCDQQALLNTGFARAMLTEAFKGLTNLETVEIRDFCARRERDDTYWNSWGATAVYHDTGVRLGHGYRRERAMLMQPPFASHVFSILLYSLGMARRLIQRLETSLHSQFSRETSLPDIAFHLANFTLPTVMPVLQNLTALFLPVDFYGPPQANVAYSPFRHFLRCTPNLMHLRLNFSKSPLVGPANADFLEWLAAVPIATHPSPTQINTSPQGKERPPSVHLSHLTALDLGQVIVTEKLLFDLLHKFAPTLRHLSLWRISIYAGRPGLDDSKPNAWSHFFKRLASVPELQLAYLKVGALSQVDELNNHQTTKFHAQEQAAITREFTGSTEDMARFVASLARDVAVDWPQPMIEDDGNDDTSNSDNEDMDDDGEDEEEDGEEDTAE